MGTIGTSKQVREKRICLECSPLLFFFGVPLSSSRTQRTREVYVVDESNILHNSLQFLSPCQRLIRHRQPMYFLPPCASSTSASLHSSVQRGCNGRARNTPFSLLRIKEDIEITSKTGHRERASAPPAHALFAKWVEELSSPNLDSRRVLSVRVTLCSHLLPPLSGLLVAAKT